MMILRAVLSLLAVTEARISGPSQMEDRGSQNEGQSDETEGAAGRRLLGNEITIDGNDVEIPVFSSWGRRRKLPAIGDETRKWKDGFIPYDLSEVKSEEDKKKIRESLERLSFRLKGCIEFKEKNSDHRIKVRQIEEKGCKSEMGSTKKIKWFYNEYGIRTKNPGYQILNLESPGCMSYGTIQHEFLHALGLHHTQTRSDRDKYVELNRKNSENQDDRFWKANFEKNNESKHFGLPYDYRSVMHYDDTTFGKHDGSGNNKKVVIETIDRTKQDLIGNRDAASIQDILLVEKFYKCTGSAVKYEPLRRSLDLWNLYGYDNETNKWTSEEPKSKRSSDVWKNKQRYISETKEWSLEEPQSKKCASYDNNEQTCEQSTGCRWNADFNICDIPIKDCFEKNVMYTTSKWGASWRYDIKKGQDAFDCKALCTNINADRGICTFFTYSSENTSCDCYKCEDAEKKEMPEKQATGYVSGTSSCESAEDKSTKEKKCLYNVTKLYACMYDWYIKDIGCAGFCSSCFEYGALVVGGKPYGDKISVKDPAECAYRCKIDRNCSHFSADFANSQPECQLYGYKRGAVIKQMRVEGRYVASGTKRCAEEVAPPSQTNRTDEEEAKRIAEAERKRKAEEERERKAEEEAKRIAGCNQDWKSRTGHSCNNYSAQKWCTQDGKQGTGWVTAWGDFDDYAKNEESALVCPQCGCTDASTINVEEKKEDDDEEERKKAERERKAEAERKRKAEAERGRKAEAERKRKAEAERKRKAEAERKKKAGGDESNRETCELIKRNKLCYKLKQQYNCEDICSGTVAMSKPAVNTGTVAMSKPAVNTGCVCERKYEMEKCKNKKRWMCRVGRNSGCPDTPSPRIYSRHACKELQR